MKNNIINKNNLRVLLIGTILILIAGLFWRFFYFFELFSHFYLQYFVWVTILLIIWSFLKDKVSIIISIIILLYLGYFVNQATIFQKDITTEVDLYYLNAHYFTDKPNEIIQDIKKYNPKHLAIVELNTNLYNSIKNELNYKDEAYFNSWLWSFWFFTSEEILDYKAHYLSYPIWEIKIKEADILLVHPLPWLTKELFAKQKNNFQEIRDLFNKNDNPKKIIIWDFNSTFYSNTFKSYFWDLYYKPIYSRNIKWILRLPIDYAIWNEDFYTVHRSNLWVSDHTPLLINFNK